MEESIATFSKFMPRINPFPENRKPLNCQHAIYNLVKALEIKSSWKVRDSDILCFSKGAGRGAGRIEF